MVIPVVLPDGAVEVIIAFVKDVPLLPGVSVIKVLVARASGAVVPVVPVC